MPYCNLRQSPDITNTTESLSSRSPEQVRKIMENLLRSHAGEQGTPNPSPLDDATRLSEDLAIDSLTRMELSLHLEKELNLEFKGDAHLHVSTVGDLHKLLLSMLSPEVGK